VYDWYSDNSVLTPAFIWDPAFNRDPTFIRTLASEVNPGVY